MSIKIYNGFEFVPEKTSNRWKELLDLAAEFRKEIQERVDRTVKIACIAETVFLRDREDYGLAKKKSKHPYYAGYHTIKNKMREGYFSGQHHPLDFHTSLVVYPFGTKIFGQQFGTYGELWMEKAKIKDFWYGNQSDKPEGISTKDWNRRESTWFKIFGEGSWIPSENGLVIDIIPPNYPAFTAMTADKDLITSIINVSPSFDDRVRNIAGYLYAKTKRKNVDSVSYTEANQFVSKVDTSKLNKTPTYKWLVENEYNKF